LQEEAQTSILNKKSCGEAAKEAFVDRRIHGNVNLWDRMTRVKFHNWDDLSKRTKLKSKTKEFQLRATTSLFSRLMVIAKSERNLDLQAAVSQHEFHNVNHMLMNPDGTLITCKGKSDLVKALEDLVQGDIATDTQTQQTKYLIIDGMAVVQSLMNAIKFKTCADLGRAYAANIDSLLSDYSGGRVIFDNYHRTLSIKDDIRYTQQPALTEDVYIEDNTPITDSKKMLCSKKTKDHLTLYLADKCVKLCKKAVVTATREDVLTNVSDYHPTTEVSSQEGADTLMMPHALEVVNEDANNQVDFFTQDTDWWVLILRRLPQLGQNTGIVTGSRANC
jgi:hypothetical protein